MAELWDQGYLPNFVGASVLGALPFAGRALRFAGYTPATRESIRRCLDRPYPRNVTAAGMRKGFAALAAEKEAMLVPGYMFGTSQLYTVAGGWLGDLFEQLSRRLRMSITLFHGRWGTLLPHPHPLACALGEPVDTREVRDAGDAHALWCARLRAAYEEHRGDFGWAGRPLFFEGEDALPPPPRDPLESYTALPRLSKL
ncbi:unnamed protein product [Prorocentrum cordatum]|uniref:diacylglycerol O-acyltransferase n=1 Tax=Prorocentrum cordatum TaxID=2364126 RepID=A0ABN9SRW1_9DINO|nr:unnamed protein product [Polarella glacialis]